MYQIIQFLFDFLINRLDIQAIYSDKFVVVVLSFILRCLALCLSQRSWYCSIEVFFRGFFAIEY